MARTGSNNYQTPTDNQQQSTTILNPQANNKQQPTTTNKRTQQPTNVKINRAHVAKIKHSPRTQRRNKRGNTPQPRIDSTRTNSV